jgi:hypothetical protein
MLFKEIIAVYTESEWESYETHTYKMQSYLLTVKQVVHIVTARHQRVYERCLP